MTVIEPKLSVVKTSDVSTGQAGTTVTYTVQLKTWRPMAATDAYNLSVSDPLPADETYVGSSLTAAGGTNTMASLTGGVLSVTADSLALGSTITMTYQATLNSSVLPGEKMTNTAAATWTSLAANNPAQQAIPNNANSTARSGSGGVNNLRDLRRDTVTVD